MTRHTENTSQKIKTCKRQKRKQYLGVISNKLRPNDHVYTEVKAMKKC